MDAQALQTINVAAYGPTVLGNIFSNVLYGAVLISAYCYLSMYKRDPWYNKLAVVVRGFSVCILAYRPLTGQITCMACTANFVVGVIRVWQLTVVHAGDVVYLIDIGARPVEWIFVLTSTITTLLCQAFLILRINAFSRAMLSVYGPRRRLEALYIVPILSVIIWSHGAIAGLWTPVWMSSLKDLLFVDDPSSSDFKSLQFHSIWQTAGLVFTDLCIAGKMTFQLWTARTGFGASNKVLRSLIVLVLLNWALVLGFGIGQIIAVYSTSTSWVEFCIPFVGNIHALSQLAILLQPRLAHQKYFAQNCGTSFGDAEAGSGVSSSVLKAREALLGHRSGADAQPPTMIVVVGQGPDALEKGFAGHAADFGLATTNGVADGSTRHRRGNTMTFFEALDAGSDIAGSSANSETDKGAGGGAITPPADSREKEFAFVPVLRSPRF